MKCAHVSSKSTSIEAHRNTECIDLCFQFPIYRLVRCIKLSFYNIRSMWMAINDGSYWLIEMNIKKTLLPSALSFLVLNVVEKPVLHYAGLSKSALRNKQEILPTQTILKENRGNTKNISFQFHYRRFSQQRYSTLSYYYRCVTKRRRWGRSPLSFLENWKKVPWF